jgi:hypothetical protein
VILIDIAPFLTILGVVMLGSTLFFAINSPSSDDFSFDSNVAGPFRPFLTLFETMLSMNGSVQIDESTSWLAVLMIVFFMGFVVVVL